MKNIEQMKNRLLLIQEIEFNEPHMRIRMDQRGVKREPYYLEFERAIEIGKIH